MVLHENVKVGQNVEVRYKNQIVKGTVKYKGPLNGVRGDWVGVALDEKVGIHDGMIKGRRYFMCDPGHGIFTVATRIHFIPLKRSVYNSYRTKSIDLGLEEDLFGTLKEPVDNTSGFIVEGKAQRICDDYRSPLEKEKTYSLRHSISSVVSPRTKQRPQTARSMRDDEYRRRLYENDYNDFTRSSTIPITHMPHSAMKHQDAIGWTNVPLTRYWTVYTAREAIKRSQWNDISY